MSDFTDNYAYYITSDLKGDHKIDVLLGWKKNRLIKTDKTVV